MESQVKGEILSGNVHLKKKGKRKANVCDIYFSIIQNCVLGEWVVVVSPGGLTL